MSEQNRCQHQQGVEDLPAAPHVCGERSCAREYLITVVPYLLAGGLRDPSLCLVGHEQLLCSV